MEIRDKAEPILWANNVKRERVRRVNGEKILERFPQSSPDGARRWLLMVDSAGNVLPCVLTSGAADHDLDGPHARQKRAKWRREGWFHAGACPVALVSVGDIEQDQIDSTHDHTPCQRGTYSEEQPCRHALAEIESRRAAHKKEESARLPKLRDLQDQLVEAQKQQMQSNQDLIAGLSSAIEKAVSGAQGKAKKDQAG